MKKILCPGEALIDLVSLEKTNNLKSSNTFVKKVGGAAVNVCGAISKFGVEAHFMGAVGDDPFGEFIKEYFIENNLNIDLIDTVALNTTLAFVTLDEDCERDFIFNRGADAFLTIKDQCMLANYDVFHFGSATAFLGGDLECTYNKILKYAQMHNKFITFDPNYRVDLFKNDKNTFIQKALKYIKVSNLIKLSEEELYLITGIEELYKACDKLSSLTSGYLVITLGSNGSLLYYANKYYHIPTIKVQQIDTTGAGDAFIGSLIAKVMTRDQITVDTLKDDIYVSNIVGALTTTKYGGIEAIPTQDEVNVNL